MTYDQWKTRDPNDKGFYDMPEDDGPTELDLAYDDLAKAKAEIERLQDAKRRALAIADERSKENVRLRAERDAMVKALRWIADNPGAHPTNIQVIAMDALGDVGTPLKS